MTDLKLTCTRCNETVEHKCRTDLREALQKLLDWVPEGGYHPEVFEAVERQPGFEAVDLSYPFFGSQSWSYNLMAKSDARTFHALLHNVCLAAGMDPEDMLNRACDKAHAEILAREERSRAFQERVQKRAQQLMAAKRGNRKTPQE